VLSDDELLDVLSFVLTDDPAAVPPAASLATVRQAVLAARADARPSPATDPRKTVSEWARRIAAGGAAVAVLAGGSGVAFAAGGASLPPPLRQAARAVGLPVDSPALAGAKSAQSSLARALAHGDTQAVANDADRLRHRLTTLDQADMSRVAPQATRLLARADPDNDGDADTAGPPPAAGSTPPTSAAAGVDPDGDRDHHAGTSGGGHSGSRGAPGRDGSGSAPGVNGSSNGTGSGSGPAGNPGHGSGGPAHGSPGQGGGTSGGAPGYPGGGGSGSQGGPGNQGGGYGNQGRR